MFVDGVLNGLGLIVRDAVVFADDVGNDAVVVKVNIDEAPQAAARHGVQSIPTFAVFANGEIKQRLSGVVPKQTLREALSVN